MPEPGNLSRRERQILAAVVRLGQATVGDVREALNDPPSYSAVRTTMGILVDKDHLRFKREGRRYLYRPRQNASSLRRKALRDVVHDYFGDSAEELVHTLLDAGSRKLGDDELDRIASLVEQARRKRE